MTQMDADNKREVRSGLGDPPKTPVENRCHTHRLEAGATPRRLEAGAMPWESRWSEQRTLRLLFFFSSALICVICG